MKCAEEVANLEVICASVENNEATLVDNDSSYVEGDISLEEIDNLFFLDSLKAFISRTENVWTSKTPLLTAYTYMHISMSC